MKTIFFNRQTKVYHFFLHDKGGKILTKITERCSPFSIGDTFKVHDGKYKGEYQIKVTNAYSNVHCDLI